MTQMMHVAGMLTPSNPDAVKWGIGNRIATEVARNELVFIFNGPSSWANEEWKEGRIVANSHTETPGGRPAVRDFITRLYVFVTTPGVKELGLEGEFVVTVSRSSAVPLIFNVRVGDANVSYKEATVTSDGDFTPFMEKWGDD